MLDFVRKYSDQIVLVLVVLLVSWAIYSIYSSKTQSVETEGFDLDNDYCSNFNGDVDSCLISGTCNYCMDNDTCFPKSIFNPTCSRVLNVYPEYMSYWPYIYDLYLSTYPYFDWDYWYDNYSFFPPFYYSDGYWRLGSGYGHLYHDVNGHGIKSHSGGKFDHHKKDKHLMSKFGNFGPKMVSSLSDKKTNLKNLTSSGSGKGSRSNKSSGSVPFTHGFGGGLGPVHTFGSSHVSPAGGHFGGFSGSKGGITGPSSRGFSGGSHGGISHGFSGGGGGSHGFSGGSHGGSFGGGSHGGGSHGGRR